MATTLTLTLRRVHTRGTTAFASYGLAGANGILFANTGLLATPANVPTSLELVLGGDAVAGATLTYHSTTTPAGQPPRYNYRLAGVAGVWQVSSIWFGNAAAPATLVVQGAALAVPTVSGKAAAATSAVVAQANVTQAAVQGAPVAPPSTVASVVAQGAAHVVAAAQAAASKPNGKARKAQRKAAATAK